MSRIISASVPAWITGRRVDPRLLIDGAAEDAISALNYYALADMTDQGWVKCGTAEITLTLHDEKQVVNSVIAALRAEKNHVLARAESEVQSIDRRINELLCIEHTPEDL